MKNLLNNKNIRKKASGFDSALLKLGLAEKRFTIKKEKVKLCTTK